MYERGDERIALLEQRVGRLEAALATPEGDDWWSEADASAPTAPAPAQERPVVAPAAEQRPRPPVPRRSLEDFLGGRVLGWAGAVTVLLGVALFVAVAIGRGWIGESLRIALAFGGSAILVAGGAWLHERRGGTQASLAMTGCGLAGLFLALTAGAQLYHLYAVPLALAEAALIGVVGTVLAVRWNSRTLAALAIGGALLAPALVGAESSNTVAAFMLIVLTSAVGVLVMRRWNWLAVGCFVISAPQVAMWVGTEPGAAALVVGLSAYAVVNAAAAFGYELRVKQAGLRPSSALLVIGGALVAASCGYYGIGQDGHQDLANWWIAGLAAVHVAAGVLAVRSPRVAREIGLVATGAGAALADIAFGTIASGPVLAAGWGATAVGLAALVRRRRDDAVLTQLALGGQLVLALLHVLLFDASPVALGSGVQDLPVALVAIASVGISAFLCARLDTAHGGVAAVFDAVAAIALAYATAYALDGAALVAAWAGIAVALAGTARREPLALVASLGFLGLAGLHAGVVEAPLDALAYGVDDLAAAAVALVAVGVGCLAVARQLDREAFLGHARAGLEIGGVLALLYVASVAVVTAFQPSAGALDTGLALGVRQQGQVLLSALWATAGVLALVAGLRCDGRGARFSGFALLTLAFGKVMLFDLSTLDSIYRVASCVALGLLLLGSAFAYQRMRPRRSAAAGTDG